jgi:LysM repeat protein
MTKSAAFVALFGVAAIFAIGNPKVHAQTQTNAKPEPEVRVTIQQGDTLSKIADANSTTYIRIYDANADVSRIQT